MIRHEWSFDVVFTLNSFENTQIVYFYFFTFNFGSTLFSTFLLLFGVRGLATAVAKSNCANAFDVREDGKKIERETNTHTTERNTCKNTYPNPKQIKKN